MKERFKTTTKVVEYIKKNIKDGNWTVGTKIPSENEICKELNVSRISVRSGLEPFVVMSIIASHQGKGKFVISTDISRFGEDGKSLIRNAKDILESLELRKIVEPEICRQVAETITDECLCSLKDIVSKMVAAVGDSGEFVRYDMLFHKTLCEAMGNHVMLSVMQPVFSDYNQLQVQLNKAIGYYGGLYYHTLIIDALEKRDGKQAFTAMQEHIQKGIDDLSAALNVSKKEQS